MKFFRNIKPYNAINLNEFVSHSGNRISSKAIIDDEDIEIRFFSAAEGEEIDKESYEFETIFICIEGKIKLVYNEYDEVILEAGQMIAAEKGIDYGIVALQTSKYYNILVNKK